MMHYTKSTIAIILMFSAFTSFCGASEKESTFQDQAYTFLKARAEWTAKGIYTGAEWTAKTAYAAGKNTVPVILVDPVEREAQLKELRSMPREEMLVPVVTGIIAGEIYAECLRNVQKQYIQYIQCRSSARYATDFIPRDQAELMRAVGTSIVTGIALSMAKKMFFGYLHPKEKKRDAVDSVDTIVTGLTFAAANATFAPF